MQTKTNKKAVLWQGNRTYDAVVKKNDTYRNLQRHRAVLPAIARLSCFKCVWNSGALHSVAQDFVERLSLSILLLYAAVFSLLVKNLWSRMLTFQSFADPSYMRSPERCMHTGYCRTP